MEIDGQPNSTQQLGEEENKKTDNFFADEEMNPEEASKLGAKDMQKYQDIIKENEKSYGSVSKNDFETYSLLGEGSYGRVILVKKKDSQKQYAMKILKKKEIERRNQVSHTMTERRILEALDSPFIVKMDYAF